MKKLTRLQLMGLVLGPAMLVVIAVILVLVKPAVVQDGFNGTNTDNLGSENPLSIRTPTSLPTEVPDTWEISDLTPEQKLRAEQLTSLFENGKLDLQYDYVENLDDGRGYTSGRAGFTTATGDAYAVVQLYTKTKPNNSLAKYLPVLKKLAEQGSDSVKDLKDYPKAWRESAGVKEFRQAQDSIVEKEYYLPSKNYADKLGLNYAITRAFLYDTIIQHGDGKDKDSISALIEATNNKVGGFPKEGVDEIRWLGAFISVRKDNLQNPNNEDTQDAWSASIGRCDVYRQLLDVKNYALKGPIKIETSDYKVTVP